MGGYWFSFAYLVPNEVFVFTFLKSFLKFSLNKLYFALPVPQTDLILSVNHMPGLSERGRSGRGGESAPKNKSWRNLLMGVVNSAHSPV